jgi:hypothetical protein
LWVCEHWKTLQWLNLAFSKGTAKAEKLQWELLVFAGF